MADTKKGLEDLYDEASLFLTNKAERFYAWRLDPEKTFCEGQICKSVVWYEGKKRWYLVEDYFDPTDEPATTWLAKPVRGDRLPPPRNKVIKYFGLEQDEFLVAVNSKIRPVVLLQRFESDWWNHPGQVGGQPCWLCAPIFTYKEDRHTQRLVLNDQKLSVPFRLYMPTFHSSFPGTDAEGCARFEALQMISESSLQPVTHQCATAEPRMSRRFKLSGFGLSMLRIHLSKCLGLPLLPDESSQSYEQYSWFVEYCEDIVNNVLGKLPPA